jgi:hypothetical protein
VRALIEGYRRLLDAVSRHPELPIVELLAMSAVRWRKNWPAHALCDASGAAFAAIYCNGRLVL